MPFIIKKCKKQGGVFMEKFKNLKYLLMLAAIFVFSGVFREEAEAAKGDLGITVNTTEGIRSNWDEGDLSGIAGFSYDEVNNVITLNNYTGGELYVEAIKSGTFDLEIKLIGENNVSPLYSDGEARNDELFWFDNVNVTFTGNGTLNMNMSKDNSSRYFELYYGDLIIDGPTVNLKDSRGTLVVDGDFILQKGTLNIERTPHIYTEYLHYYDSVECISEVIVTNGKINIEYIIPEGYENSPLDYDSPMVAIDAENYSIAEGSVNLIVPEKIKNVYATYLDIPPVMSFALSDGSWTEQIENIKGISYKVIDGRRTLVLNGYDGGDIYIKVEGYGDLDIVIEGENTIHAWGKDDDALCIIGCNVNIIGNGTLNFEMSDGYDDAIYMYSSDAYEPKDRGTLTIDGPVINVLSKDYYMNYGAIAAPNLLIKAGYIYVALKTSDEGSYERALFGTEGYMEISGGTIVVEYIESDKEALYYYRPTIAVVDYSTARIDTSNCVIVFVGTEKAFKAGPQFGDSAFAEGCVNIGDNTTIIYASSLDAVEKVDISKFKATLSQTKYEYDGKKKEPKVTVGGLVEGHDYTVSYSDNVNVGTATATVTGKGVYTGTIKLTFTISGEISVPKADGPKAGTTIKDKKYIYKVTKAGSKDGSIVGELAVTGLKKKSLKQVKIAAVVTIDGVKYKVTSVGAKAFKGNKKIVKATIGKNVKTIGANAFANCKKLKQVTINSKVLKSIGKSAFAGDKKLSKVIIKSNKLKKVGKKALKSTSKKLVVKVPKKKKKAYAKLFKKAGNKKAKVK